MNTDRSVKVKDIVEKFQMEVLYPGADFETETLTITDVNRPGLYDWAEHQAGADSY